MSIKHRLKELERQMAAQAAGGENVPDAAQLRERLLGRLETIAFRLKASGAEPESPAEHIALDLFFGNDEQRLAAIASLQEHAKSAVTGNTP